MHRRTALLVIALPLVAATPLAAFAQGAPAKDKLAVTIDRAKVDIPGRKLEVKMNHPAEKVKLKVIGESGATLADLEQAFGGAAPGTALIVSWKPSSEEAVARIEVWGHDTSGFYSGVAILPWSVSIPHEEVNFQTDSDVIRPTESPKLEASAKLILEALKKHKDLGPITLYIIGHTDTVGKPDYNMNLSRKRARSIAAWFRGHGVTTPVSFEGLGESSPPDRGAASAISKKRSPPGPLPSSIGPARSGGAMSRLPARVMSPA